MGVKRPQIVPVIQKQEYDCGPAAVATFLKIIGKGNLVTENLAESLGTTPEIGTRIERISKFLVDNGVKFEEKIGASVLDLDKKIQSGMVCLVDYQAWGSKKEKEDLLCGHYCVVFGVDEKYLYMFDPSMKKESKVFKNDFDKWWKDKEVTGEVFDHWMIAGNAKIVG